MAIFFLLDLYALFFLSESNGVGANNDKEQKKQKSPKKKKMFGFVVYFSHLFYVFFWILPKLYGNSWI